MLGANQGQRSRSKVRVKGQGQRSGSKFEVKGRGWGQGAYCVDLQTVSSNVSHAPELPEFPGIPGFTHNRKGLFRPMENQASDHMGPILGKTFAVFLLF